MVFNASNGRERWEGIVVCGWIILIDIILLLWMLQRPIDLLKFVLILLLVLSIPLFLRVSYRAWIASTLEYWVDRNAITIRWAGLQYVLPLPQIKQIYENDDSAPDNVNWLLWPAHYFQEQNRSSMLVENKSVSMLASRPLSDCLLLDLGDAMFAISPEDPQEFVSVVQERYELGVAIDVPYERSPTTGFQRVLNRIAYQDSIGIGLLTAGAIGLLMLFGLVMAVYPSLPGEVVLRYSEQITSNGAVRVPAVIRAKSALFVLPMIGLISWAINGICGIWMVLRDQRIGAYLLWGGAIVVQLFSLVALIGLLQ